MSLSTYRGSTQDNSGGVQVAVANNENGSAGGALTVGVQVGNKTTFPLVSVTGITSPYSFSGGDLSTGGFGVSGLYDLGNVLNVVVMANSNVASAALTGRLIWYNNVSGVLGTSDEVSFLSDPTLKISSVGNFICAQTMKDVNNARYTNFFVDSISSGIWSIGLQGV